MAEVLSLPSPLNVAVTSYAPRAVWSINLNGIRNLYVAEEPAFSLHRLTGYPLDDGQEFRGIQLSPDRRWVVYVRGGEREATADFLIRHLKI